jgi:hypothetical protein
MHQSNHGSSSNRQGGGMAPSGPQGGNMMLGRTASSGMNIMGNQNSGRP